MLCLVPRAVGLLILRFRIRLKEFPYCQHCVVCSTALRALTQGIIDNCHILQFRVVSNLIIWQMATVWHEP